MPSSDAFFAAFQARSEKMRAGLHEPPWKAPIAIFLEEPTEEEGFASSMLIKPHHDLPRADETSMAQYLARLDRRFAPNRFGVQFRSMEREWIMWSRFSAIARELQGLLKLGAGRMDLVGFLGNYRRTAFGVHKDSQHVFTFVVAGRKRMLLWPIEAFAGRSEVPDNPALKQAGLFALTKTEFARARKKAIVLEARPGDLMYWPPSYWHCADPTPGVGITVTLGVDEDLEGRRRFRKGSAEGHEGPSGPSATSAVETRLEAVTGCGLGSRPDAGEPAKLAGRDRVRLARPWPIRFARLDARTNIVAANGYCIRVAADVSGMITALNKGAPLEVQQALDRVSTHRTSPQRREAASLVATLCSWHALVVERVSDRSSSTTRGRRP